MAARRAPLSGMLVGTTRPPMASTAAAAVRSSRVSSLTGGSSGGVSGGGGCTSLRWSLALSGVAVMALLAASAWAGGGSAAPDDAALLVAQTHAMLRQQRDHIDVPAAIDHQHDHSHGNAHAESEMRQKAESPIAPARPRRSKEERQQRRRERCERQRLRDEREAAKQEGGDQLPLPTPTPTTSSAAVAAASPSLPAEVAADDGSYALNTEDVLPLLGEGTPEEESRWQRGRRQLTRRTGYDAAERLGSYYAQPSYRCVPTGMLDFTPPRLKQPTARAAVDAAPGSVRVEGEGGQMTYAPWSVAWPRFIRQSHENWFANYEIFQWRRNSGCEQQTGKLHFCEASYVRGSVSVLHDVVVSGAPNGHDCGPNGNVQILTGNAQGQTPVRSVDTLYWAVIPATWTFQHWMENTLPKIAQAMELVPGLMRWPKVAATQELLLDRFPIIARLHEYLGWDVFDERFAPIQASNLIYSCVAPPLHPYLWQQGAQHVLRVQPKPMSQRRKIVYCGRTKAGRIENAGRRVLNEAEVMGVLGQWNRSYEVVEFNHLDHPTIPQLLEFFATARLLIGPHGGCLTNLVFLGCNSAVVELFPLVNGVRPPLGHPGMMMYLQASFLEQQYWMLPVTTPSSEGDMNVPLDELTDIMVAELGPPR